MQRFSTLEINKEAFTFSAGHFTIFSATEREQLHGHNYYVSLAIQFSVADNGLSFDYRHYKKKLARLCDELDRHFLLPSQSAYLPLQMENDYVIATFNQKKLFFLKEDVIILPLTNITIETLANYFLQKLLADEKELAAHCIHGMRVKVYNGLSQSSDASWNR